MLHTLLCVLACQPPQQPTPTEEPPKALALDHRTVKVRSHQCIYIYILFSYRDQKLASCILVPGSPSRFEVKRALVTIFEEALLNHKHFLTWRHLIVETFRMIIKKKITFCSKDRSPSSRCRSQLFKKRCFWFSGCFRSNCRRIASYFFRSSSFTSLCCALQDLWVIPQYPLCLGSDWLDAQLRVALVSCDVQLEVGSTATGNRARSANQLGTRSMSMLSVPERLRNFGNSRWVADGWPMGMFSYSCQGGQIFPFQMSTEPLSNEVGRAFLRMAASSWRNTAK